MSRDDLDRLAAEHVMGLLDGEERREAERLAEGDADFQAALASWRARFSELDDTASPVAVSGALWSRIEGGLAEMRDASPVRVATATPVIVPDPLTAFRALWRNLAFWRVAGLAGSLATIALAVGLGVLADRGARTPALIAVLLTDDTKVAQGVINTYADGRVELVPFASMQIPPGRNYQVWASPGPNQNVVPVGLLSEPRSLNLDLRRLLEVRRQSGVLPDQLFGVSVEPPGGSLTGLPSGPVLMHATAQTAL